MTAARDMIGPYFFKGIMDNPETPGDAIMAENVEWIDDHMVVRKGTKRINRFEAVTDRVTLAYEFSGTQSAPFMLMVGYSRAALSQHLVQLFPTGSTSGKVFEFYTPVGANGRPSCVEFNNKLVLFTPLADTTNTYSMWEITPNATPYYEGVGYKPSILQDPDPVIGGDPGDYFKDPINGSLGCVFRDRLFVVRISDPSKLYYSNRLDLNGWPEANFIAPFQESTDPIVALASFAGKLWSFTRSKIAVTDFTAKGNENNAIIKQFTGAVCQQAVTQCESVLAFLSDEGLLFMDANGNVSDRISPYIKASDINRETLAQYRAGFGDATLSYYAYKRQLWLTLPAAQRIFVLDLITGNWSTRKLTNLAQCNLCTTGRTKSLGGDIPTAVWTDASGEAAVVAFESATYTDYQTPASSTVVRARWVSHSIPDEGSDLFRLYRYAILDMRDCAASHLSVGWTMENQTVGSDFTTSGQVITVDQRAEYPNDVRTDEGWLTDSATTITQWDKSNLMMEKRLSISGAQRGRSIHFIVKNSNLSTDFTFNLRKFRFITRARVSNRER